MNKFVLAFALVVLVASLCSIDAEEAVSGSAAGGQQVQRCSGRCFRNFAPVCASNGRESRTFSNQCVLDYHNCEHPEKAFRDQRPGVCPEEQPAKTAAQAETHQSSEETST